MINVNTIQNYLDIYLSNILPFETIQKLNLIKINVDFFFNEMFFNLY